jgi:hypothetical protein
MFLFLHIKLNKESSETNYVLSVKWLSFNVDWHASSLQSKHDNKFISYEMVGT